MFDKVAAAFSVVALGAAGYAVYKTSEMTSALSQSSAIIAAQKAGSSQTAVVDAAAIEQYFRDNPVSETVIENYIRENPEVMISSLENFQRDQQLAQQKQQAQKDVELVSSNEDEIFKDGYSFVAGNPEGDVTMVEFSDYNCGYCKRAHEEVKKFIEADGNIRLVVKEFPILGPGSIIAGRAALASSMQDDGEKYAAFNNALMTHRGSHNESSVMKVAEKVGLDVDQLQVDMKSPDVDKMIRRTVSLAEKLSINGTPGFIIGNQVVRGFVPAAELKRLTEAARSS